MKRKAPSREWRNEVRKKWSDNPPVPASSILEHYQHTSLWWWSRGWHTADPGGGKDIKRLKSVSPNRRGGIHMHTYIIHIQQSCWCTEDRHHMIMVRCSLEWSHWPFPDHFKCAWMQKHIHTLNTPHDIAHTDKHTHTHTFTSDGLSCCGNLHHNFRTLEFYWDGNSTEMV